MDNTLEVVFQEGSSLQSTFDKVHGLPNGASNTQADIFSDIQDVVLSPLEGLSAFVIAFGQAGSGKTYTVAGDVNSSTDEGLINRSISHLAQGISEITDGSQFQVYLSLVEISQEVAKQLVKPQTDPSHKTINISLAVQQYEALGFTITEHMKMCAKEELVDLTQQGLARQIVAYVAANSRSHVLINLAVQRQLPSGSVMHGELTLVKLAGSEEQDKVLALALPLGQDFLKGAKNEKVRMALIICCSPAASDAAETLCSMRFGTHAKSIMTSAQAPADGKAADTKESQQVPAVKTAADVKEDIHSLEASVEPFIQKLMDLDEQTSVQAPDVRLSAGMLVAQLLDVLKSTAELGAKITEANEETIHMLEAATEKHEKAAKMHEKSTRLLETAQKEREETQKAREDIASMLGRPDAAVRPQANARAARPRVPLCFIMLDIVVFPVIVIGVISLMVCMWMKWF